MKVYRVVPNSFLTNEKLNSTKLNSAEDIYYRMGYTSFIEKSGLHCFNTLYDDINEEGKYFYLFPEDAIMEGDDLIGKFHRLSTNNFYVVEYDIPDELVLKNIGFGDYTKGIIPWYIMETYINKTDLIGEISSMDKISNNSKVECLIDSMNESLKMITEFKDWEEIMYFSETLGLDPYYNDSLESIINNEKMIKEILLNSNLYFSFLNQNGKLIKTPYITGKIIPVNNGYINNKFIDWKNATDYFQSLGIRYDLSQEQKDFKIELINNIKDKRKVKSLLKQKNYLI